MQYFTEEGDTHREVLEKVRIKYGESAQVVTQRTVRKGGFMGFFAREKVEMTGYVRQDTARESSNRIISLEEDKKKLLDSIQERTLQEVLTEIRSLKESIGTQRPGEDEHPTIVAVRELLDLNEFGEDYRESIIGRIKDGFSLSELDDFDDVCQSVIEWIGDGIAIATDRKGARPRILALIGPTGVGKTTTIAKLASVYRMGLKNMEPRNVRMISIDCYRIGAQAQITKYAEIMEVPISCVETEDDLRKTIAMYRDVDLILVDTIGNSPREAVKLAEMKQVLSACGNQAEVHLAVAATTKTADMIEIMRQFEPFRYESVVVTKLDETSHIGNVLTALSRARKPVSFVSDGQSVPDSIHRADPVRFLINLEGFEPNRPKLEERYAARPAGGKR
ncbi:MAG: flagellar biosynthesis protein FlhF [Spirochaetes bacterium]|nr:flagellar biosynthesis protein FlhF [Spirochaetota bacterium]